MDDEYRSRQFELMRAIATEFIDRQIPIARLIDAIGGLNSAIDDASWEDRTFPILLSLETNNAFAEQGKLSAEQMDRMIEKAKELVRMIDHEVSRA